MLCYATSADARGEADCFASLMLGRMGGSGNLSIKGIEDPKVSLMESSYSSSGSSKRAKVTSNVTQIVSCLVDGCNSDLSRCREYHRRHKVCEVHSKSPKVTIRGLEQRFCQQCSRFHSLVEFDEGKRSCRKRLDGHNRRRRKSQPESLSRNAGKFLSQQGSTMLSFSSPTLVSSGTLNSAWAGSTVKAGNSPIPYMNCINARNNFYASLAFGFGGNQFKALHGNGLPLTEPSARQRLLDPNSAPAGNSSDGQRMFSEDGLSRVIDSDCALSLLSSAQAETRETVLNHMMPPNPIPSAEQSLFPNIHQHGDLSQYSQGVGSKLVVSILGSHDADNVNLHCQGMFQSGPDGSSAGSESHHSLSFRGE